MAKNISKIQQLEEQNYNYQSEIKSCLAINENLYSELSEQVNYIIRASEDSCYKCSNNINGVYQLREELNQIVKDIEDDYSNLKSSFDYEIKRNKELIMDLEEEN